MEWLRRLFRGKPPLRPETALERALVGYYASSVASLCAAFDQALRLGTGFVTYAPMIAARLRSASVTDFVQLQSQRTSAMLADLKLLRSAPVDSQLELFALASLASNGFVREAAVRELGELGDPVALRYLIPRTGDWVPQVRAAAVAACRRLVPHAPTDMLLQLGGDYDAWFAERPSHESARSVRAMLDDAALDTRWTEVLGVLFTPGSPHRAFVRRLCLRNNRLDGDTLGRLVRDGDPAMRAAIAQSLAMHVQQLDDATIDGVLHDRVPVVTARFVAALPQAVVAALAERLRPLCFRRSSLVRHVACARLASIGWSAVAECRRRLADAPRDVDIGVIACLGEHGGPEDQALLAPYVDHREPRTRAAALRALGRIAPDEWWPFAIDRLASAHAGERRAAAGVLRRAPRAHWVEAVRELGASGNEPTRTAALQALTHDAARGSWSVVPDLLTAILAGHSLPKTWGRVLGWWLRNVTRGWLRADEQTRAALREVWTRWRAVQPAVPEHMRDSFVTVSHWIEQQLA